MTTDDHLARVRSAVEASGFTAVTVSAADHPDGVVLSVGGMFGGVHRVFALVTDRDDERKVKSWADSAIASAERITRGV